MTQGTLQPIVMEEVDDPAEVSKARIRREMFDRNFNWLADHSLKPAASSLRLTSRKSSGFMRL